MKRMDNFQPNLVRMESDKWLEILQNISSTKNITVKDGVYTWNQIVWQILGASLDKDDYLEMIYDVTNQENTILLSENLDKSFSNKMRQSIQKIIQINQDEKGLSINRMVAFLEGEQLIPKLPSYELQKHVREHIKEILTIFKDSSEQGLLHSDFRRVFTDILKWLNNHTVMWLSQFPEQSPLIIWYGDMKVSEEYFLYFMIRLGFDVVVLHPEGKLQLEKFLGKQQEMIHELPTTSTMIEFPKERPVRKSTVANRASQELDVLLYHEDSMIYRPWQFRDYTTLSITLKTTYDDIFIYHREKALIRPNFKVADRQVSIPVFFSKIAGISKNRNEYWEKVNEIVSDNNVLKIDKFPFSVKTKGNQQYHYQGSLGSDGLLNPDKMIKSNWWKYKELPTGLQIALASAISRYVDKVKITPIQHETIEQTKLYLFSQAINIKDEFLRLLQQFDYPQEVPKIIIYNTEKDGELSREDASLLSLLNEFGIDIFIFNPTGQNDIELHISEEYFDSHWLEEISFDEEFRDMKSKGNSIIQHIVGRFIK